MIDNARDPRETSLTWLALFTSMGTLLCCALPITLVSLGMGATVASLVSSVPFLVPLSLHKIWVFLFAAGLVALSAWVIYRPGRACPVDSELGRVCSRSQRWNRRILWVSVFLWCVGFFAAYLVLPLQIWIDG